MKARLLAFILLAGGSLFARTQVFFGFGVGAPVTHPYYYAHPVVYEPYYAYPAYGNGYWYPASHRYVVRTRVVRTRYVYRPARYYYRSYPTRYVFVYQP